MSETEVTLEDLNFEIRNILVLVDMKHADHADKALNLAAWIGRAMSAQLTLMTVAYPLGKHIADVPEKRKPDFLEYAKRQSQKHGITMDPLFTVHESVVYEVVRVAEKLKIDLIILQSGPTKLVEHVLGSKASNISLKSKCSVFVVR
ncbi:universal stress protein [Hyphomonas pacifica]|uniref:universal stress protein n=1 Tax=Hyphomonas pacifica TaxID=1280941 RepID=UPI000DBF3E3A|nr:universal stress protein [Hyphomonas pacifica]RAN34400.1 hypothetical protein HY11_15280 [Hyphomonas pacifica]